MILAAKKKYNIMDTPHSQPISRQELSPTKGRLGATDASSRDSCTADVDGWLAVPWAPRWFRALDPAPGQALARQPGDQPGSSPGSRTRRGITHQTPHALFCLGKRRERERVKNKILNRLVQVILHAGIMKYKNAFKELISYF